MNTLCDITTGHYEVELLIKVNTEPNNANVINANDANIASTIVAALCAFVQTNRNHTLASQSTHQEFPFG